MSDFALYAPGLSPIPSLKKDLLLPLAPTNAATNPGDFQSRPLHANVRSQPSCSSAQYDVVGGQPQGFSNEHMFASLPGNTHIAPLSRELQMFQNVSSGVAGSKLSEDADGIGGMTSQRKRPISVFSNNNSQGSNNNLTLDHQGMYPHKRVHKDFKRMEDSSSSMVVMVNYDKMMPSATIPSDHSSSANNTLCSALPSYCNGFSSEAADSIVIQQNSISMCPNACPPTSEYTTPFSNVQPQMVDPLPASANSIQPLYQQMYTHYQLPNYNNTHCSWVGGPDGGPHVSYEEPTIQYEDQDAVDDDEDVGDLDTEARGRKSTRLKEKRVSSRKIHSHAMPSSYAEQEDEEDEDAEGDEDGLKGLKLYCSLCKRHFASRNSLLRHKMHLHYGARPFNCTVCSQTFAKNDDQQKHLRLHNPNRPYSCPYCAKKFSTRANCVVHERSHTGEKPYQCTFCFRSFAQISARNNHLRTHTKERPFFCACGKSFAQSATRTAHIQRQCTNECAPSKSPILRK